MKRTDYSEREIRANYEKLTKLLIRKHLTITTMESATSGQIASLITDTEGSSAVLKGAFVTYSNEAKIQQGVPREIIEKYTVYSEETAAAMARACLQAYSADIGIGVTGTMGNVDPANPGASVPGQVYFAIAVRRDEIRVVSYSMELAPQSTRLMYKLARHSRQDLCTSLLWPRKCMKCLAASCRKNSCDDCYDRALRGGCKALVWSYRKKPGLWLL